MTPLTLARYYERHYRPDRHATPKQANTAKQYRAQINNATKALHFQLAADGQPLRDATIADLSDDFVKRAMAWHLDRGRSIASANQLYRTLCAIWRHAEKHGATSSTPRTEKYKEPRRTPTTWTVAELRRIVEAARRLPGTQGGAKAADFWAALILTAYASGARKYVLLNCPTACFDPARGELLLPAALQKHHADQRVELIPEAVEALETLDARGRGLLTLFADRPKTERTFYRRLRRIIADAGLRPTAGDVPRTELFHNFRRAFATQVAKNSNLETAQAMCGHSHPSVTRAYIDPSQISHVSQRDVVTTLWNDDPDAAVEAAAATLRIHRPAAG